MLVYSIEVVLLIEFEIPSLCVAINTRLTRRKLIRNYLLMLEANRKLMKTIIPIPSNIPPTKPEVQSYYTHTTSESQELSPTTRFIAVQSKTGFISCYEPKILTPILVRIKYLVNGELVGR